MMLNAVLYFRALKSFSDEDEDDDRKEKEMKLLLLKSEFCKKKVM